MKKTFCLFWLCAIFVFCMSCDKTQKTNEKNEYNIEYVKEKENATRFITDKKGKIIINNLEVYASKTEKYSYTAYEVANENYGYGSVENIKISKTIKPGMASIY